MNINTIKILILIVSVTTLLPARENNVIDLRGEWQFSLDSNDVGLQQKWYNETLSDRIVLPGTTDEAGYGKKTVGSDYGILTRIYKYIGPAWYQKEIDIPKKWKNQTVRLFLERVLWESQVFIDGKQVNSQDALATPHIHKLGKLKPGKHKLTLRINNDMIYNIGDKGHAYGEYTQTIWNGIVGRIKLQAQPDIRFKNIRIFPDAVQKEVKLDIQLIGEMTSGIQIEINLYERHSGLLVGQGTTTGKEIIIPIKGKIKQWNEFTPHLYRLEAKLTGQEESDYFESTFGFCSVSKNKSHVLINGEPIFLRGNLDCVHFPLTGYPSTSINEWKRIFQIYKDNGLNHVRFHSWCPPDAAFEAADELGIYIQAEASLWIDWWMGRTLEESKNRPEMFTRGEPKGLGEQNPSATEFVRAEINRIIETYGNHPSFIMFCIGNELGNSDFDLMGAWMKEAKEKDPRRLYAASTARTVTPYCDYSATHHYPGIGGVRQYMTHHNHWDYEDKYSQTPVPTIAHEIGQWPVYPSWHEIDKYTGILKARNLEEFKNTAIQKGIFSQNEALKNASGKLSILLYKDEIESFLRTPSCSGIQLLGMQDYQGQGEALIGWLDCFYDSKGIVTPDEIRRFHSAIVPLVKLHSYIYESEDELLAEALLFHYGPADIINGKMVWKIVDSFGNNVVKGDFSKQNFKKSTLHSIGHIRTKLPKFEKAEQLTLFLEMSDSNYKNSWNLWVFPKKQIAANPKNIIITEKLDNAIFQKLSEGEKVLLIASNCGDPESGKYAAWRPLYWSASFFPGQSIETIGLLLQHNHPALQHFPTHFHSDWQWWNICKNAHGFVLDSFPEDYFPIAQPISDFHYNHKLGSIFEVKHEKGKLLICGYDLNQNEFPEVCQLKYSLLKYMESENFNPVYEVDKEFLKKTFKKFETAKVETPAGFENSIFYVKAGEKKQTKGDVAWKEELDAIIIAKNVEYSVQCDGIWKDDIGTSWHGKNMQITLKNPEGIKGNLYVFYHDWNNQNRDGVISFEGRDYSLGPHFGDGKWVKLNIMREDTNDGKLVLNSKCTKGGNLMITALAIIPVD
ncbi:MAG: glycoside hydrolase family 2 [Candidatus Marinimicrobia bacterium]|nr:glycoside hydrolase family 2 [Candidatus Neomarinimicrobiota bacterium]